MLQKFNWGHGITLFYILFVGVIFTALFASMRVDHGLVRDDYYQLDLQYQERYDEIENANHTKTPDIYVNQEERFLSINFGETGSIQGEALFYRPSDKKEDFKASIHASHFEMNTSNMIDGRWVVKLHWTANGLNYYFS